MGGAAWRGQGTRSGRGGYSKSQNLVGRACRAGRDDRGGVHGRRRFVSDPGDSPDGDAVLGHGVIRVVVQVRRVQQRLGRDASHVEAGTSEGAAPLDAGHLEAELGALDGGDVSARTAADDDDVLLIRGRGGRGEHARSDGAQRGGGARARRPWGASARRACCIFSRSPDRGGKQTTALCCATDAGVGQARRARGTSGFLEGAERAIGEETACAFARGVWARRRVEIWSPSLGTPRVVKGRPRFFFQICDARSKTRENRTSSGQNVPPRVSEGPPRSRLER